MMDHLQIITTADGSASLLHTGLQETYHSRHGAVQESLHVFIRQGLDFLVSEKSGDIISVFEVGLGTGLNALLTWQACLKNEVRVHYTAIEAHPLSADVYEQLRYSDDDQIHAFFRALHSSPWNSEVTLTENFRLLKVEGSLLEVELSAGKFDLIYFDAFAPSKQPEMWALPVLEKIVRSMKAGAVFVTYSARGQLKRDLASLDLEVGTLEGPPGKKEMVRAVKREH